MKSAIVKQSQAMPNPVEERTAILDGSEAQHLLRPNESRKQHECERQIENELVKMIAFRNLARIA
jgi:hypothetical protein